MTEDFPGEVMILIWLSFLVILLDRFAKITIVSNMTEGESIPVLENIFHVTYVLNPGAAFGMLPHNRTFFLIIGAAAVAAIIWLRKDILSEGRKVRCGAALFLGYRPGLSLISWIFVSGRYLMWLILQFASEQA